jgi:hypothetical protein
MIEPGDRTLYEVAEWIGCSKGYASKVRYQLLHKSHSLPVIVAALAVPTDNHHKAFCTPDCYNRFYTRRCKVCEKELPREASPQRNCCRSGKCQADFRKYRHTYTFGKVDAKSPCGTGAKSAVTDDRAYRIVAGPELSDFALWAGTLPDPKPQRPAADKSWRMDRRPGDLAAEWTASELVRREAEDVRYVAEDEARLQSEPVDASGNYALQQRQHDR